jgi:hypothetical protein
VDFAAAFAYCVLYEYTRISAALRFLPHHGHGWASAMTDLHGLADYPHAAAPVIFNKH